MGAWIGLLLRRFGVGGDEEDEVEGLGVLTLRLRLLRFLGGSELVSDSSSTGLRFSGGLRFFGGGASSSKSGTMDRGVGGGGVGVGGGVGGGGVGGVTSATSVTSTGFFLLSEPFGLPGFRGASIFY